MLTEIASTIKLWFTKPCYGSELERYILSHQPQSIYDVEQLTKQFDTQLSQGIFK